MFEPNCVDSMHSLLSYGEYFLCIFRIYRKRCFDINCNHEKFQKQDVAPKNGFNWVRNVYSVTCNFLQWRSMYLVNILQRLLVGIHSTTRQISTSALTKSSTQSENEWKLHSLFWFLSTNFVCVFPAS